MELESVRDTVDRAVTLGSHLATVAPRTASLVARDALNSVWIAHPQRSTKHGAGRKPRSGWQSLAILYSLRILALVLQKCQEEIRALLAELAAAKAWEHFFDRLTESERQALNSWTLSMRKLGKGTGKYASRHRTEVREAMQECRSAIPAWIMPIYRVAQSIRPAPEIFDVVIIDEASQSGPDALFLQYIAKRIVVVGDDKQISPEAVGTHRGDVEALRERYLGGVRNRLILELITASLTWHQCCSAVEFDCENTFVACQKSSSFRIICPTLTTLSSR